MMNTADDSNTAGIKSAKTVSRSSRGVIVKRKSVRKYLNNRD